MKSFLFQFSLFIPVIFIAQTTEKVPFTHSPNGEIVFDTYDTFLNDEYGGLDFYFEDIEVFYEKGTYFLKGDTKGTDAFIWMDTERKVRVKNNPYADSRKIDIDELAYYTTKLDSFFVTNRISLKDKQIEKPTMLQYLGTSEKADYAMYYKIRSGSLSDKKIVQLKKEEGQDWVELNLNIKNPRKIFSFFKNYEVLNEFYDQQELTIEDFLNSLKVEEYYNHHNNNTKIMYDKLWREVKKPKFAQYFGTVTKVVDSIFTVEISDEKGQKMYDLKYSSLHPLKRHGTLTAYDGKVVKLERTYDYGDLITGKRFKDGKMLFEYNYYRFKREEAEDVLKRRVVSINSDSVKTYGDNSASLNDVKYEIRKKEIISAYTETLNGKRHLYSNYVEPITFDNLETQLHAYFNRNRDFNDNVLKLDYEGSMLLQIVTNNRGKVLSHEILSSNNERLTKLIQEFANDFLTENGRRTLRIKQIKSEDRTATYTFILPINFEHRQFLKTFSRPSYNNWNWNWHWQMHHNMMWQQQQFMNNIPKF